MSAANPAPWNSVLGEDIRRYVAHKRALGRKYATEAATLRLFDRFLCERRIEELSRVDTVLIEAFLGSRQREPARSHNHLLGVIRCFFDWLVVQERIEHSPVRIRPRRAGTRPPPFLFDRALATRLLDAARALPDRSTAPNRGRTYHLIFAMMYTLGLRVGEVSRLELQDVDIDRCVLSVRQTKFAKDRLVPFGPRLEAKLAEHLGALEHEAGRRSQPDSALFSFRAAGLIFVRDSSNGIKELHLYVSRPPNRKIRPDKSSGINTLYEHGAGSRQEQRSALFRAGRAIHPCTIAQTFHQVVTADPAFSPPPGVSAPRLHCLRHSFAVGTLLRWYRAGVDVSARLIHLSTFLGHVDPESTAWYLSITTELLDEASQRFERYASPTVEELRT